MGWINCPRCGKEFYIHEMRYPCTDRGDSLSCTKCGTTLHSWGKGTRDYTLIDGEEKRKQDRRIETEYANYPRCNCGNVMVKRKGSYGEFFGCAAYPNGCSKTANIDEDEDEYGYRYRY